MKKHRLYALLLLLCAGGFLWLVYSWNQPEGGVAESRCLVKKFTHLPCPSCGSTRSVLALLHGNFTESIVYNPFGLIIFTVMVLAPLWIMTDLFLKRESFYRSYRLIEKRLNEKRVAIPLALLVLGNWIWNVLKEL